MEFAESNSPQILFLMMMELSLLHASDSNCSHSDTRLTISMDCYSLEEPLINSRKILFPEILQALQQMNSFVRFSSKTCQQRYLLRTAFKHSWV